MMVSAVVCLGITALGLQRVRARGEQVPISSVALAALLLGLMAAVQMVPLPHGLLQVLSPHMAQGRAALVSAGLPDMPTSGAISANPSASALASFRWLLLGVTAMGLAGLLRAQRRHRHRLVHLAAKPLAVVGVIQVIVGLLQTFVAPQGTFLGIIETTRADNALVAGTFVNSNHGAALMAMAALAACGLAVERKAARRAAWAAAAVICATGVLLSASRGAIAAMVLAAVAFGVHTGIRAVWTGSSRREPGMGTRALPWAAVTLLPVGLTLGIISQSTLTERFAWELQPHASLEDITAETKIHVIQTAAGMIGDFPLAGIGADAFASVAPAWLGDTVTARFSFVESDPVELLLAFGLPVGGLAIVLALLAWWRIAAPSQANPDEDPKKRHRDTLGPTALGLVYALGAFAISASVSFNVEILGLAIPALVLAEVLLATRRRTGLVSLPPIGAAILGVVLAAVAFGLLWTHTHLGVPTQSLSQAMAHRDAVASEQLIEALDQTPLDGHAVGMASMLMSRDPKQDAQTAALAKRAIELSTVTPFAPLAQARVAARNGQHQRAAEAYQHALLRLRPIPNSIVQELLASLPEAKWRAQAIPGRRDAIRTVMLELLRDKRHIAAMDLATELQTLHPKVLMTHVFAVKAALAAKQPLLAEMYAGHMIDAFKNDPSSHLLMAESLVAADRRLEAAKALSNGIKRLPQDPTLRLKRAELILHLPLDAPIAQRDNLIKEDLEHLRVSSLHSPASRAHFFYLSGLHWKQLGRPERAKVDFARAVELRPKQPGYQKALKDISSP